MCLFRQHIVCKPDISWKLWKPPPTPSDPHLTATIACLTFFQKTARLLYTRFREFAKSPRLPLIPSQDLARRFACLAWETVRDAAAREDARMQPGTPPTMDSHYDVAGGVPEMPESSSDWTTPPFRDAASTFRETAVMESDGLIAMDTGALVDVNSGVHFAVDRAALDSIVSSGSLHAIVSL